MRVTLCSGLGPAWNVDQDDLTVGRASLCVVPYPQSPIPAKPLSQFHFWVPASGLMSPFSTKTLTNVRIDDVEMYSSFWSFGHFLTGDSTEALTALFSSRWICESCFGLPHQLLVCQQLLGIRQLVDSFPVRNHEHYFERVFKVRQISLKLRSPTLWGQGNYLNSEPSIFKLFHYISFSCGKLIKLDLTQLY